MGEVEFSREQKAQIVEKVKTYFVDELNQDIGSFDAEFLIDFFSEEIGAYFFNKGLSTAQALYTERIEEIGYLVQELEKPVD